MIAVGLCPEAFRAESSWNPCTSIPYVDLKSPMSSSRPLPWTCKARVDCEYMTGWPVNGQLCTTCVPFFYWITSVQGHRKQLDFMKRVITPIHCNLRHLEPPRAPSHCFHWGGAPSKEKTVLPWVRGDGAYADDCPRSKKPALSEKRRELTLAINN